MNNSERGAAFAWTFCNCLRSFVLKRLASRYCEPLRAVLPAEAVANPSYPIVLFLGVLPIAATSPVAVTFGTVAAVGACVLSIAHAGVFAVPFVCIDSVLRK